jgi:hypothetical protein
MVHRLGYRGVDPKRLANVAEYNRIAARIEGYLNAELAKRPVDTLKSYSTDGIADAIGEDSRTVHKIIFATDGGAHGITILKGDFERATKLAVHR